jgi:hypothetical protein
MKAFKQILLGYATRATDFDSSLMVKVLMNEYLDLQYYSR